MNVICFVKLVWSSFNISEEQTIIIKDRDGAKIEIEDLPDILTQFSSSACFMVVLESQEATPLNRTNAIIGPALLINDKVSIVYNKDGTIIYINHVDTKRL